MRPETSLIAELRRLLSLYDAESGTGDNRASVLGGLVGLGALPSLTSLISLHSVPDTVGPCLVGDADSYITIARCHQRLYWTTPAKTLYEASYAHTRLGIDLLRGSDTAGRAPLAAAVAESALLTARLAFFDLGQTAIAQRCFDVAFTATRDAGDHALAAAG